MTLIYKSTGLLKAAWDKAVGNSVLRRHGLDDCADRGEAYSAGTVVGFAGAFIGTMTAAATGASMAWMFLLLAGPVAGAVTAHRLYASYKIGEMKALEDKRAEPQKLPVPEKKTLKLT